MPGRQGSSLRVRQWYHSRMEILSEAAQILKDRLGSHYEELTLKRLVTGLFFTGVELSDGSGGLCFTPVKEIPEAVCCPTSAGRVFDPRRTKGMRVEEVLKALSSSEPIKVAVALATLNALHASCLRRGLKGDYQLEVGVDAQRRIDLHSDRPVAVVGALVPVLKALKARGGRWWVIEKDPRTLKGEELRHFVPADRAREVIPQAEVLVVTGATLVNHTLEGILEMAQPGAEVAVIGPTVSFTPEPLFERGVTVAGGVLVKDAEGLLDVLAAGGSGYHFYGELAERIVMRR